MMERFGELLERLVYSPARNAKLKLLADYFRTTPDPDRGYALAALTDGLPFSLPIRRALSEIMEPHADPVLFRLSRDYVGDTAETVALLWPGDPRGTSPTLSEAVQLAREASRQAFPKVLAGLLDRLTVRGRFALIKLYSGALRAGVSARLAKTALAQMNGADAATIEEIWHALEPPYEPLFTWIEGRGPLPDARDRPVFRPVMLAHPLEAGDLAGLDPADFAAEWKWDGIRVQIAAAGLSARVYSRAGDDITGAFPEIADAFAGSHGVADGELLVMKDGAIRPFNNLQQRLNRKSVTTRMRDQFPGHVRLYDLLFDGPEDIRALAFHSRRARLEAWFARARLRHADLSAFVPFADFPALEALWRGTRAEGIEGLMLKRRDSPYLGGRPKGHWWKWKRAPLTADCVLMYAQRGSGKRSSYYSDYTFGVWDGAALVPVGKSYSGFTDAELHQLDRWIRANTTERFGPVRAVSPGLVLEIAFDALQASGRHKSGLAMRFPRVHRIRWDKPAAEADRLDALKAMLPDV